MIVTLITTTALLMAAPLTQVGAQVSDPAALVPANTLMYFGTPSLQAGSVASRKSAMRRILDEPEVKAFLQKPVGQADKALVELIEKSGLPADARPKVTLAGMMGGEDGVPMGRFFVALTHFGLPAGDAEGEPDVGLVVGLEMLNDGDLGLVRALWSMIPVTESTVAHGQSSYALKQTEDGPPLALAYVGRLAVLSLSERALRAVLDNAAAPTGGSLADSADYKQMLALGGGLRADSSTFIMRPGQLNDMVRGLLAIAARAEPQEEMIQKAGGLLDEFGMGSVAWVGGESHREPAGRVISTVGAAMVARPTGLISRMSADSGTVDLGMLAGVPGNCLSMTCMGIDWLAPLYDFAVHAARTLAPEETEAALGMVQGFMGPSSLRDDVLANMHGMMLSYTMPGEGFPGQPAGIVRVPLRDPARFAQALNSVVAGATAAFADEMGGLKLVESEHEGRKLYELDISATPLAMSMMQPAFAIDGESLVACLQSSKALKTALNGVQGTGSLADNSELMGFVHGLAEKGGLTELSFSDNAKTFGSIYGQLAPAVSMMAGMADDLPIDLALMPTEQAISKHLGYSFSGSYRAGSELSVHRRVSEFSMGDFFVPTALAASLVVLTTGRVAEAAAPEVSPDERVQADLRQLSAAMTVYKISQGGYPTDLGQLVMPLPDYEEGCLGRPELPRDPWGNGYLFRLNERKRPFLWSAGPNGADEGGAGDDIAKK
ncbi:MAG: hypothetical protein FJ296_01535 [Planctomycetes bacterium]|nr:hypothetical protein [Planctomycetota bacterium]